MVSHQSTKTVSVDIFWSYFSPIFLRKMFYHSLNFVLVFAIVSTSTVFSLPISQDECDCGNFKYFFYVRFGHSKYISLKIQFNSKGNLSFDLF